MKELVGSCSGCGRDVYCLEGFLNGVVYENNLYCFKCNRDNADQNN